MLIEHTDLGKFRTKFKLMFIMIIVIISRN